MKTQITFQQSIGKTLAGAGISFIGDQMVVVFTDNTFASLGIFRQQYDGDDEIEEKPLKLLDFGDDQLIALGIVTAEELTTLRMNRGEEDRRTLEERERQQYEFLKHKFEDL